MAEIRQSVRETQAWEKKQKKTKTLTMTVGVTTVSVTAINTMHFISYCKQRELNVSSLATCRLMFTFTYLSDQ